MAREAHPLAQVLRGVGGETPDPLTLISGALVVAVDTTVEPHEIAVRLADGTVVDGVRFLGWWAPTVDARVELLRVGPSLLGLGPVAPAPLFAGVAPAPAVPPPAPPVPPTVRNLTVQASSVDPGGSWDSSGGYWRDDLVQGGPTGKRTFLFYGSAIAAARSSGTILSGTIYLERLATAHGVSGDANVRLGTHGNQTRPASGAAALDSVSVVGGLARGKGRAFQLTAAHVADLNAGAAGFGLEPGASGYDSPDYLRVTRAAPAGSLSLTVEA